MPLSYLPNFNLSAYQKLLISFQESEYQILPVEAMKNKPESHKQLFLRHDIDLHIPQIHKVAEIEKSLGIKATYFIPLTLHFNVSYPENQRALIDLREMGHNIGFHYDLKNYPYNKAAALAMLEQQIDWLSHLVGKKVESICMHFPWGGREDFFKEGTDYLHPHDPKYFQEALYISDSSRAWRDEKLLDCFRENPPKRVLLNTHPELWLGDQRDRLEFLKTTLLENTLQQHKEYVLNHMGPAWEIHPGVIAHDRRENKERRQSKDRRENQERRKPQK